MLLISFASTTKRPESTLLLEGSLHCDQAEEVVTPSFEKAPLHLDFGSHAPTIQVHHESMNFPSTLSWDEFPYIERSSHPGNKLEPFNSLERNNHQSSRTKATSTKPRRSHHHHHVRFSTVDIRVHTVTVGEHDWCHDNLPISLDWGHTSTKSIPVDDFDWMRERQGRVPRGKLPKLSYSAKKRLLRKVAGYQEEDFAQLDKLPLPPSAIPLHRSKTVSHIENLILN